MIRNLLLSLLGGVPAESITPFQLSCAPMPDEIRAKARYQGYRHFVLFRGGIPQGDDWWANFRKWADRNLPKYAVSHEDCIGMTYTSETISFYITRDGVEDGADQYMGFRTRHERDMFLDYCPSAVCVRD